MSHEGQPASKYHNNADYTAEVAPDDDSQQAADVSPASTIRPTEHVNLLDVAGVMTGGSASRSADVDNYRTTKQALMAPHSVYTSYSGPSLAVAVTGRIKGQPGYYKRVDMPSIGAVAVLPVDRATWRGRMFGEGQEAADTVRRALVLAVGGLALMLTVGEGTMGVMRGELPNQAFEQTSDVLEAMSRLADPDTVEARGSRHIGRERNQGNSDPIAARPEDGRFAGKITLTGSSIPPKSPISAPSVADRSAGVGNTGVVDIASRRHNVRDDHERGDLPKEA